LLFVTIGHLILIILLQQVWQPQALNLPERKLPKLNAFIYYESKVEIECIAQVTDVKPEESSLKPKPVNDLVSKVIPKEVEVKEVLKEKADKEVKAISAQASDTNSVNKIKGKPAQKLRLSTQGYFQRKRAQALDDLVIEQSTRYTRKRSLSEMDREMIILALPEYDTWAEVKTLDTELDPNRIVKQGSTCYRVVQTPTPLNPYAENLGYPFRCDGKTLVSDLKKAIAERAGIMGIKRQ